jgi:hypothetical protein
MGTTASLGSTAQLSVPAHAAAEARKLLRVAMVFGVGEHSKEAAER